MLDEIHRIIDSYVAHPGVKYISLMAWSGFALIALQGVGTFPESAFFTHDLLIILMSISAGTNTLVSYGLFRRWFGENSND